MTTIQFREQSRAAVQNAHLQGALKGATTRFLSSRAEAVREMEDWEALRERASQIREETLANLDQRLDEFTSNASRAGATVVRVSDASEALAFVGDLIARSGASLAVKGKSMVSEEIDLNCFLAEHKVTPVETDLGEYIIQLAREAPSHIIAPAIHKTRGDVGRLFDELLGEGKDASIPELTAIARRRLREMFLRAELGFTGANFLIADTGSIVLVENEGNIRLSTTLPRIHIAIAGIEKVIPRYGDLGIFLPLLIRSATGQKMSSYVSVITGPRRARDTDGPEEVYILLLDNGRRRILQDPILRPTLKCIRCAACLNTCPVYQATGGHTYGWAYSGPIGAVLTPQLIGLERAAELPFASSLCGACADICPVKVPLPHLLLELRSRVSRQVVSPVTTRGKKLAFKLWARAMTNPRTYSAASRIFRRALRWTFVLKQLLPSVRSWIEVRGPISSPRQSFREMWSALAARSLTIVESRDRVASFTRDDAKRIAGASSDHQILAGVSLVERFLLEAGASGGRGHYAQSFDQAEEQLKEFLAECAGGSVLLAEGALELMPRLREIVTQSGCEAVDQQEWSGQRGIAARARASITRAFGGIASSGSLLFQHGAREPRTFSLLAETHIALVEAADICLTLDEVIARSNRDGLPDSHACWTFVTGPSRTGDIELTLTIGVHGPRQLLVIVLDRQ